MKRYRLETRFSASIEGWQLIAEFVDGYMYSTGTGSEAGWHYMRELQKHWPNDRFRVISY